MPLHSETDEQVQDRLRMSGPMPEHVAIIMDGNGRWAKQRGKHRVFGHHKGIESVRDIIEASAQLGGISHVTLYTFSTENWGRPATEVRAIMELLIRTIRKETQTLLKNSIRLRVIGDPSMLPARCQRELSEAIELTRDNDRMTLTLALSYSGRWEILQAVRSIASQVQAGHLHAENIDEALFEAQLNTVGMPDPDLLIRTGGDYRISNFLLWQLAYTELYITDRPWPEFRRTDLYEAIRSFQARDRRFGKVKDAE
ncbi:MAG: isoprenyl transferase [Bacteroidota bacterium]